MSIQENESPAASDTPLFDSMYAYYKAHKGEEGDMEGPNDFARKMEREVHKLTKEITALRASQGAMEERLRVAIQYFDYIEGSYGPATTPQGLATLAKKYIQELSPREKAEADAVFDVIKGDVEAAMRKLKP